MVIHEVVAAMSAPTNYKFITEVGITCGVFLTARRWACLEDHHQWRYLAIDLSHSHSTHNAGRATQLRGNNVHCNN